MILVFALHTVIAAVATSYLALGVFVSNVASDLWWPYGMVMFFLTTLVLAVEYRSRKSVVNSRA